jgi:glutathione synthase/RimK-type ligase-like ATP-grasp enzyme
MISEFATTNDPTAHACENVDVTTMSMGIVDMAAPRVIDEAQHVAVAQFVQAAASIVGMNTDNSTYTLPLSTYNDDTNNSNNKDHEDDFLTETEFALLSHVTTTVGDFDPLSNDAINNRPNFIPILEARGGTDKDEQGHRRDTLPIANAIDQSSLSLSSSASNNQNNKKTYSAVFQFLEENGGLSTHAIMSNNALRKYLKKVARGVIVRVNPGTLSAASQKRCDDMLRDLSRAGAVILSHPDVASSLGAKDSLVKIKNLKCGLLDTAVYYTPESFQEGFLKMIAFQPRVIKQNRGSQGEGIWIVKLKDEGAYCDTYGQRTASLDTEIVLMEAFDNHVEHHTVGDFIDFCIHGRTETSPEWTTTSAGRYFEGGLAAGAMVVDQRFLPRIVEGEVRCLMIGSELVEIVHKKPKEGGLSATLASGATYTKYAPDDAKFAKLVKNFEDDIPYIMGSFGMCDQPLPLLWTADYIYGDSDDDLFVGEINCSCVGITQQLHHAPIVADVAMRAVFGDKC